MKKLIVLLLIFCSLPAYSATKKKVTVPSNSAVLSSSSNAYLSGSNLYVQGDSVSSYIDRLGSRTPVGNIVPTKTVPKSRVISAAKNLMRTNPGAIAGTVVISGIIAGIGWAVDELTGQLTKTDYQPIPFDPSYIHWSATRSGAGTQTASTPSATCDAIAAALTDSSMTWLVRSVDKVSDTRYDCWFDYKYNSHSSWSDARTPSNRVGTTCPSGTSYNTGTASCAGTLTLPVTDNDLDTLDITSPDTPEFYRDLLRESCIGSTNPNACYDTMVEHSSLSGPSTVTGPRSKTTTYQTNADGTTSTVETTTSTDFDLGYGEDYFTYNPKTTTDTKVDGSPTSTTVTEEDPAVTTEEKPAEEEKPESSIAGMNCNATVACAGDAIQCAMASTQKDTRCILEELATIDETELTTTVSNQFAGSDYQPFSPEETTMVDLSSYIDTSSRIAASCPVIPPINITIAGNTTSFDFAQWLSILCEYASWFGVLLVVFSLRNGVEVIARGFG